MSGRYDESHEKREPAVGRREFNGTMPRLCASLWHVMEHYLNSRHISMAIAKRNGWYPSASAGDRDARIVIPATASDPGNVYWQARAVSDMATPRYQSPYAPRGDAVVVAWPIYSTAKRSAVVEGPMDALAAAEQGLIGVALMGAMPPPAAIALTRSIIHDTMALVVIDSDAPEAMTTVYTQLCAMGVSCKLRNPYPQKDLAECTREKRGVVLSL